MLVHSHYVFGHMTHDQGQAVFFIASVVAELLVLEEGTDHQKLGRNHLLPGHLQLLSISPQLGFFQAVTNKMPAHGHISTRTLVNL